MQIDSAQVDPAERARQAIAVGNAISRLHREHYGRGATTTRTVYQRNHLVAFLEDIYTPVERTLLDAGRQDDVKHTRQVFQVAMRERFSDAVSEITGRKVIAFMSQVHFDPDMAAEIFVLEAGPTERRGRRARGLADAPRGDHRGHDEHEQEDRRRAEHGPLRRARRGQIEDDGDGGIDRREPRKRRDESSRSVLERPFVHACQHGGSHHEQNRAGDRGEHAPR